MPQAPAQSAAKPTCDLDWANKAGWPENAVLVAKVPGAYALGFRRAGTDEMDYVSINLDECLDKLWLMPPEIWVGILQLIHEARRALGYADDEPFDGSVSINLGSQAAGVTIENHPHFWVLRSESGMPHSGMGKRMLEQMHDKLSDLIAAMLTDLVNACGNCTSLPEMVGLIMSWNAKYQEFLEYKSEHDAYGIVKRRRARQKS